MSRSRSCRCCGLDTTNGTDHVNTYTRCDRCQIQSPATDPSWYRVEMWPYAGGPSKQFDWCDTCADRATEPFE